MMDPESTFEIARQRQADLRALAARPPHDTVADKTRREAVGRALVRLGQWIAGHCPEVVGEPTVAEA